MHVFVYMRRLPIIPIPTILKKSVVFSFSGIVPVKETHKSRVIRGNLSISDMALNQALLISVFKVCNSKKCSFKGQPLSIFDCFKLMNPKYFSFSAMIFSSG